MLTIEVRLGRLTLCSRLLFGVLPLAAVIACGGASTLDTTNPKGGPEGGGQGNHEGGAGGSAAASGHEGNLAGSGGARAGNGGTGNGGTGGDGTAGSGANAGSAGESGGRGGNGGNGGSAGMGVAGSGGNSAVCHAPPPTPCGGGAITLSRSCVTDAMATVGTSLPLATCRTMCQTMFTSQCSVSAVQDATITVLCNTACPVGNK